jgi:hypothetical protein
MWADGDAPRRDPETVAETLAYQGNTGNWERPALSSSPNMMFMFCTA